MFSKEESKKIRQEFWIFFGRRYPRKWLLYNTKIKNFALKFSFDNANAQVSIDMDSNDLTHRQRYFDKLVSLKTLLKEQISRELIFDSNYILDSGKPICRVYVLLPKVNIHNKEDWPKVFDFMHLHMSQLELFFINYKEFIDS